MSKARLKLIIVLAVCMAACLITAGCSIGLNDINDYRDYYNVTAQVTYYGNGGYFKSEYITSRTLEYTTGATFYEIQKDETTESSSTEEDDDDSVSSNTMIKRSNFTLLGWYEVDQRILVTETEEEDKDGEKITVETIYFVLDVTEEDLADTRAYEKVDDNTYSYTYFGTTYNFVKDNFIENDGAWLIKQEDYDDLLTEQTNESDSSAEVPHLADSGLVYTSDMIMEDDTWTYVVARWKEAPCIRYSLVLLHGVKDYDYDSVTVTSKDKTTETVYEEGDIISTEYFLDSSFQRSDSADVVTETGATINATLIGYYYDEACTQSVNGATFYRPSDDASEEELYRTVYALYIPGTWTLLRTASDVRTMFNGGSANYYLMNDIDCSTLSYDLSPMTTFSGRIDGNGYTISNMSFTKTKIGNNASTAIFGKLSGSAEINDLYLENVTANYTATGTYVYMYMLFGGVNSGATPQINGLTVTNYTLNITTSSSSATIGNMQKINGVYEAYSIFYGISNEYGETDAEFAALYGGAVMDGYTVVINGETAITTE